MSPRAHRASVLQSIGAHPKQARTTGARATTQISWPTGNPTNGAVARSSGGSASMSPGWAELISDPLRDCQCPPYGRAELRANRTVRRLAQSPGGLSNITPRTEKLFLNISINFVIHGSGKCSKQKLSSAAICDAPPPHAASGMLARSMHQRM